MSFTGQQIIVTSRLFCLMATAACGFLVAKASQKLNTIETLHLSVKKRHETTLLTEYEFQSSLSFDVQAAVVYRGD